MQTDHGSKAAATNLKVVILDLLSIVPYYTGHLAAALSSVDGIAVTTASINYQRDPQFFARMGVRRISGLIDIAGRLPMLPALLRRAGKLSEYLINLLVLAIRLRRVPPDILHVQFLPLLSHGWTVELWFLKHMRACGIKIVYTVHNVMPQDGGGNRDVYQMVYRLAHGVICHDAHAVHRLVNDFGVAAERIATILHGVFFECRGSHSPAHARARLGFAPAEILILWHGILRPYKGISFLLRAWQRVCARTSNARLVIVGTGEAKKRRELQKEIASLGLESRVSLNLRFVPVEELAAFFDACDVLVYPYREITTSGALMTGIIQGKPIVATRLPAFEQVLAHGHNSLLVSYGDVEQLAGTLEQLIEDADLRRKLGSAIRQNPDATPRWKDIAIDTRDCYRAVKSREQASRVSVRIA